MSVTPGATTIETGTVGVVVGVFRAEVLKLRKRPGVWVLAGVLLLAIVLFGYLLNYSFAVGADDIPGVDRDAVLASILPEQVLVTVLGLFAGLGAPIALILGTLAVGSEYGWGTVKTLAVQRPGRVTLLAGKLAALAAVIAALVVASVVLGWVASLIVAALADTATTPPPAGDVVAGLGAGLLILTSFALLGAVLALAFRGTGLAIGLGLVYVLVAENLLLALPLGERFTEVFAQVALGANAFALSQAFGEVPAGAQFIVVGAPDAGQAVAVLAAYAVGLAVIGLVIFHRRPIT